MTDTIAHPPLPEPAGHTFPSILEAFAKVDCSGADLSGANLSGADLSGADLYGANLYGEKLKITPIAWVPLTDEDRTRAFESLPDMLEGFMKTWGWLHFAKAIEAICREKNGGEKP